LQLPLFTREGANNKFNAESQKTNQIFKIRVKLDGKGFCKIIISCRILFYFAGKEKKEEVDHVTA